MPQTKAQKQEVLDELKDKIGKQKAMVFIDFTGMKVKDIFGLRKKLKIIDGELKVAKKTLMGLALKEKGIDFDFKKIKREIALVFGYDDEIYPAKIVFQTSQENQNLKILGGFLENKFIEAERVIELAKLPTKDQLLAQVVGSIASPMSGFANVLQGNLRNLVYILGIIKGNK